MSTSLRSAEQAVGRARPGPDTRRVRGEPLEHEMAMDERGGADRRAGGLAGA